MITLSEFLGTIPCAGNAAESVQIAIREAKRLESLETPRVNAERKPLVDEDGDKIYIIVDERGCYADWQLTGRDAENDAYHRTLDTGQPHTACQVMAPVNGECPTIPLATFTPERPHEWAIYLDRFHSMIHRDGQSTNILYLAKRFATATEAQAYIDQNDIEDAYPWPVPKLTSSQ